MVMPCDMVLFPLPAQYVKRSSSDHFQPSLVVPWWLKRMQLAHALPTNVLVDLSSNICGILQDTKWGEVAFCIMHKLSCKKCGSLIVTFDPWN